jgi:hypothetical protein
MIGMAVTISDAVQVLTNEWGVPGYVIEEMLGEDALDDFETLEGSEYESELTNLLVSVSSGFATSFQDEGED